MTTPSNENYGSTTEQPAYVLKVWLMTPDGSLSSFDSFRIGIIAGIVGIAGDLVHPLSTKLEQPQEWETVPCGKWAYSYSGLASIMIERGPGRGYYYAYLAPPFPFFKNEYYGLKFSLDHVTYYPEAPVTIMREERSAAQPF